MRARSVPTQERLRQLFQYDQLTGELTWKERPAEDFKSLLAYHRWRVHIANTIAGVKKRRSKAKGNLPKEIEVSIDSVGHPAHEIIWILANGSIPDGCVIDHKNCDPWDNRLNNLRPVTHIQNMRNSRLYRNSTTGLKGVHKRGNRYSAHIRVNRKLIQLGSFGSAEEAHAAYCRAALEHFGEHARTA